MRRLTFITVMTLIVTLLAACASGPGALAPTEQPTNTGSPTKTPLPPTPVETGVPLPEAGITARQMLADMLKIDIDLIAVKNISEQEFTDSCLGVGGPAESCLQVITPGFVIDMTAKELDFTFHTSADGSVIRLAKPDGVRAAIQALAIQLGIGTNEITINQIIQKDFTNGCLEVAEPGTACTEAIVPGYVVDMTAAGTRYVYHTNMDGTVIKLALTGPSTGLSVDGQDPVVKLAIAFLAKQLQISSESIRLVSKEAVEWSDGCLGVQTPGISCITVITPGYRIVLDVNGTNYDVHTDLTGTNIVLAKPGSQ